MSALPKVAEPAARYLAQAEPPLLAHFDLLATAPDGIARLRELILSLAVCGKLVPQDAKDEPASVLLKRIRKEKACLIAAGKIKRDKPLPPIADDEKPFELPDGWNWVRFGDLVNSSEAGWSPSCSNTPRESDHWGVLKVSAVSWGEFRSDENKELPPGLVPRPEFEVQPGDFLMSRANTEELVARSAIAGKPESRLMMSDKIIRLHISSRMNKVFCNLYNNSAAARSHYAENASGTSSSMKNVSRETILKLPVPIPTSNEQSRIVARVEELRRLCAALRERLMQSCEVQTRLADTLADALHA